MTTEQPIDSATEATETEPQETEQATDENQQHDDNQRSPQHEALLKDLVKERKSRQALRAKLAELESSQSDIAKQAEALTALQTKYDRLEAFLAAMGGEVSELLDSRKFSAALFDSDTKIESLVEDWRKAHPSAAIKALRAGTARTEDDKPSMNDMLRAAIQKAR
jgi:hypothetical protein